MIMRYNSNHHHHHIASDGGNPRWVPCTARADFRGDVLSSQLSFRKNARLEVDLLVPTQNGWKWGKTQTNGRGGWFPEWATEPVSVSIAARPAPTLECISEGKQQQHQQPKQSQQNQQHQQQYYDNLWRAQICDGFDPQNNEIMGGPRPRTPTVNRSDNDGVACSITHQTRPQPQTGSGGNRQTDFWKEKFGTMPSRDQNPYTARQKQPDWDGSEVPQIVSGVDGSVTVLAADGAASSYRNEKSYKSAEAKNRMGEQFSSTGQTLAGFRLPHLRSKSKSSKHKSSKRSSSSSNTIKNNISINRNQKDASPGLPSIDKPRRQRFGMPKFSKIASFPKTTTTSTSS